MLCDAQVTGSLSLARLGLRWPYWNTPWEPPALSCLGQGKRGEETSAVPLGAGPDAEDSAGPTLQPSRPRALMHPSLGGAPRGSGGD